MTKDNKKPHEKILEDLGRTTAREFNRVRDTVHHGVDTAETQIGSHVKQARDKAGEVYGHVGKLIGKERLLGAVAGGKAGALVGAFGGPIGIIKGMVVGGAAGFVLGRVAKDIITPETPAQDNKPPPPAAKGDTPERKP